MQDFLRLGTPASVRIRDMPASCSPKAFANWHKLADAGLKFLIAAVTSATISTARADVVHETIDGLNAIFITNDIVAGDSAKFRKIVHEITGDAAVFLKSNGGALFEALAIGQSIRDHGFPTVIAANDTCASSCALIWLGGTNRYISPAARVGFHAAYTGDGKYRKETSVGNAVVGAYLTEMKLPIDAVVFATSAPPDRVRWLHPDDAKKLGIICVSLKGSPKPAPVEPVEQARRETPPHTPFETSAWAAIPSELPHLR